VDTIRFIGQLFPKGILLSATLPDLDWKWEEENLTLKFRTKINNNTVNVECDIEQYRPEHFSELHRGALDLARTATNLACFAHGDGVTCVFEFAILPDRTPSTLRFCDPSLAQYCRSYSLDPSRMQDLQTITDIVAKEPPLSRTLNDVIECITIPHVATINCGRIIYSIRKQIAPGLGAKQGWPAMHKALNVSQAYQEYISTVSTGPRHGDSAYVSGRVTTEIVKRTWTIMDRYLEYRKRGKTILTAPDFPQLA
jgi:hypothetical protein